MSIIRINELPEGSGSLSNDDIFVFMDGPSGGGVTKKISLSQIGTAILANDSRWDYFLPSAPSGVSGVEGDRSVSLTWTSSGEPVETLPVTDYVIQYSSNDGTTWTTFADVVSPSTSVVVDNLVNNTNYKFRVRAVNGIGLGAYSSMSSTLTPEMPKPSGVTGSGADGAVLLNWSAPSPSPIDGITDYLIQYSSDNGSTWTTFDDGISIATSGTVTGLTNDTGYKFRVAAVNNVETSNYSEPSASIVAGLPSPALINGLVARYRGDLGVTVDQDGYISEWRDQSGNNNHATGVNNQRPILVSSGINGLPTIDFNGSTNILSIPHNSTLDFGTLSVFAIYKRTNGSSTGNPFIVWKNDAAWGLSYTHNNNQYPFVYRAGDYTYNAVNTDNTDPHLFGFTIGNNGTFIYFDSNTSNDLGPTSTPAGTGPLQIGGYNQSFGGGFGERFLGQIAELMLFNRVLTSEEILIIKNYINNRYGLTIS